MACRRVLEAMTAKFPPLINFVGIHGIVHHFPEVSLAVLRIIRQNHDHFIRSLQKTTTKNGQGILLYAALEACMVPATGIIISRKLG